MKQKKFAQGGGALTRIDECLCSWSCAPEEGRGDGGVKRPLMCDWLCSGLLSTIVPRGWAKCTLIFILRKRNCGLLSTGVFRQCIINSCGCQRKSMRNKKLEIRWCCWLAPQAIGSEEKLVVNGIKHFYLGEPWLLIIDDLGEVSIIKQELSNLDLKLTLRAHIPPVSTDNSST